MTIHRAQDVERWRKQLEKTLAEVNAEISVLKDAKESCERAFEAKALPHDVTTECLSIREVRRQFEVVRDPVEHSLNDENLLEEKCRHILKTKCEDAYDKLSILEDIRQKLETDLQDKTEALRIDIDQLELTERSTGLSHKPDPTRVSDLPHLFSSFTLPLLLHSRSSGLPLSYAPAFLVSR